MTMKRLILAAMLMAWGVVDAQTAGVLSFTAATTTGNGSVTPVLTWSTTPAANSCVASGDAAWLGSKVVSGSATLPATTKSVTYNLQCSWGKATVTVNWVAPTLNTDNTPLTDLNGFKVYWSGTGGDFSQSVPGAGVTSLTVTPVPAGTFDFTVAAVNKNSVESAKSAPATATTTTAVVTKSVGITVNPVPMAPTNVTVN
jgi:hypothetical protein